METERETKNDGNRNRISGNGTCIILETEMDIKTNQENIVSVSTFLY